MATTAKFEAGYKTLQKLCDAFGLEHRHVRRLVIDCPLNGILTLHVEELPDVDQVAKAARVLADATTQQSDGRRQWQAIKSDKPITVTERAGVDIERRP